MIRVLIADDHAVVRAGLRQIIEGAGDMTVAGEAADGVELLRRLTTVSCDVILMDLAMPGASGLEVLRDVRRRKPALPVLVLSMYPADQYAVRALSDGAAGYLNKGDPPGELIKALRMVVEGRRYISAPVAEILAFHVDETSSKEKHAALSNREFQVLRLLAGGRKVSEIAAELGVSLKTVSTFRSRVLEKLGVASNADLVRYALKHGLVE